MKKVWTDSQGLIHKPSPGSNPWCFKSPVRRFALVSATSMELPKTVSRVWLRTNTFNFEDYNTSAAQLVAPGGASRSQEFAEKFASHKWLWYQQIKFFVRFRASRRIRNGPLTWSGSALPPFDSRPVRRGSFFFGGSMLRRLFIASILAGLPALSAPPLTTIQDVLYKADGTRFNGT